MLLLVRVVGQICFVRIKSNFSHAGRGKLLLYIVLKKKKKRRRLEARLLLHKGV